MAGLYLGKYMKVKSDLPSEKQFSGFRVNVEHSSRIVLNAEPNFTIRSHILINGGQPEKSEKYLFQKFNERVES